MKKSSKKNEANEMIEFKNFGYKPYHWRSRFENVSSQKTHRQS